MDDTISTALREALAEFAHDEQWSGWVNYQFEKGDFRSDGTWVMPAWAVERWTRQMKTRYSDLPEEEKESDRKEADKMLAIVGRGYAEREATLAGILHAWEGRCEPDRLVAFAAKLLQTHDDMRETIAQMAEAQYDPARARLLIRGAAQTAALVRAEAEIERLREEKAKAERRIESRDAQIEHLAASLTLWRETSRMQQVAIGGLREEQAKLRAEAAELRARAGGGL